MAQRDGGGRTGGGVAAHRLQSNHSIAQTILCQECANNALGMPKTLGTQVPNQSPSSAATRSTAAAAVAAMFAELCCVVICLSSGAANVPLSRRFAGGRGGLPHHSEPTAASRRRHPKPATPGRLGCQHPQAVAHDHTGLDSAWYGKGHVSTQSPRHARFDQQA
jgi:hypothetical protein